MVKELKLIILLRSQWSEGRSYGEVLEAEEIVSTKALRWEGAGMSKEQKESIAAGVDTGFKLSPGMPFTEQSMRNEEWLAAFLPLGWGQQSSAQVRKSQTVLLGLNFN